MSKRALQAMEMHEFDSVVPERVAGRVWDKIEAEAVEDYRIDFEDGYGERPGEEEDRHALQAGRELAQGAWPAFIGVRIKPDPARGFRTLDILLDAVGSLPDQFVVTLPKIEGPGEVERFRTRYPALRLEVLVETPQAFRTLGEIVAAGGDGLVAAHLGPYDFTAACGIPGPAQQLSHPLLDWARVQLITSLAGTGIRISDGPTKTLPVGGRDEVHAAWRLHAANVTRAIDFGIFQGWDLHPAQLPARYAALYAFFLEHAREQAERLKNFLDRQSQATRIGATFDDAASVRGLRNFFEKARHCGALAPEEIPNGI
jgi:citrate lyase beta subunit